MTDKFGDRQIIAVMHSETLQEVKAEMFDTECDRWARLQMPDMDEQEEEESDADSPGDRDWFRKVNIVCAWLWACVTTSTENTVGYFIESGVSDVYAF